MLNAIANARADIAANRLEEAGYELNAIHNLPVGADEVRAWSGDWFFTMEVRGYLEHVGASERAKAFSKLVADAKVLYDAVAL
jgi:hypothetical protein